MPPEVAESLERMRAANDPSPSPGPTSPPEAGQGGSGADAPVSDQVAGESSQAEAAGSDDPAVLAKRLAALEAKNKELQSQRDRFGNLSKKQSERVEQLEREHEEARLRLAQLEARLTAPDPLRDPEGASEHWQREHQKLADAQRTRMIVNRELAKLSKETGVIITDRDRRLRFGSEQEFMASLGSIREQIVAQKTAKDREAKLREELKAEARRELLKEMGVDVFDGGGAAGVGAKQTSGFKQSQISNTDFYREHQEEIRAYLRQGGKIYPG